MTPFRRPLMPILLILTATAVLYAQLPPRNVSPDQLRTHIRYLASDELEGRAAGTEGNRKAAEYIAGLMESYGLVPAGVKSTYEQPFDFVSSVKIGEGNRFSIEGPAVPGMKSVLSPDVDFRPFGFSADTSVTGQLVFAGYGISSTENNYDDFASLDVSGKIVVVLRYSPDGTDQHGPLNRFASFRNKARTARDKGAAGLIVVTGPADDPEDELIKLTYDYSFASSGIAMVSVKRSVLAPLFEVMGRNLAAIQDSIQKMKKPISFAFPGVHAALSTSIEKVVSQTANIAGSIPGSDPVLRDQIIIIGAHMDHLGYGGPGSGSLQPDTVAIHHGADDNASGTAGLLELARLFSEHRHELRRTILFLSFSAEELGTLGSRYYVNHPLLPLERTVAMINMDMIGRLKDRALTVYGTGTSPVWDSLLARENPDSTFVLKEIPDGYGPSDQEEFYAKDLPVLFFFTGMHFDYHKPSDEWQKINYEGEASVVQYVYNIVTDLDAYPARPRFVRVATSAPMASGDARGFAVTLGIIPDYADNTGGMKIGGIRPNGPAEKAGMKAGDTIVKMAGKKIMNIYDYMGILGELKAGDRVEVEILRNGQPVKLMATMEKRH